MQPALEMTEMIKMRPLLSFSFYQRLFYGSGRPRLYLLSIRPDRSQSRAYQIKNIHILVIYA